MWWHWKWSLRDVFSVPPFNTSSTELPVQYQLSESIGDLWWCSDNRSFMKKSIYQYQKSNTKQRNCNMKHKTAYLLETQVLQITQKWPAWYKKCKIALEVGVQFRKNKLNFLFGCFRLKDVSVDRYSDIDALLYFQGVGLGCRFHSLSPKIWSKVYEF